MKTQKSEHATEVGSKQQNTYLKKQPAKRGAQQPTWWCIGMGSPNRSSGSLADLIIQELYN